MIIKSNLYIIYFIKMAKQEEILHKSIVRYLNFLSNVHGEILYTSDLSGIFIKNKNYAGRISQLRRRKGIPDLLIFEPRKGYHGLFLELKAAGKSPFKKDGKLKAGSHLREQFEYITELNNRGFYATFAVGIDEAMEVINDYFGYKDRSIKR